MEPIAASSTLWSALTPLLLGAGIAATRAIGMMMVTPAFTRMGLTGMIRSCVAIAISLPIIPQIAQEALLHGSMGSMQMLFLLIKELTVGMIIGLMFGIPFWGAEMAGDLIDLQRGSTSAQLVDPSEASETTITGTFMVLALLTLFFMAGGFLFLVDGYYKSFAIWPALDLLPTLNANFATTILEMLDRIFKIGVMLIAPVVLALLLADVMLAYLSRMSPQLHIFDLSMSIKNLLFALLMVLYISYLVPFMMSELKEIQHMSDQLNDLGQKAGSR